MDSTSAAFVVVALVAVVGWLGWLTIQVREMQEWQRERDGFIDTLQKAVLRQLDAREQKPPDVCAPSQAARTPAPTSYDRIMGDDELL